MRQLINQATIFDPSSKWHKQTVDLLIEDGVIIDIAPSIKFSDATVLLKNVNVSPGWFDLMCNFNDPNETIGEDLFTGTKAAIAGGFTGVLLSPNTSPRIDNKSLVSYITTKATDPSLCIYPAANCSIGGEGGELSELFELWQNGAKAFTDGIKPIVDTSFLLRLLTYTKNIPAPIMIHAADKYLNGELMVHEGIAALHMGLKGIPAISYQIALHQIITLAQYVDRPVHIHCINTSESVKMIKEAKKNGVKLTCDVALANLLFNDEDLLTYDTNLKVKPVLGTKQDQEMLIAALEEGIIDAVCSNHQPCTIEQKQVEFALAKYGMACIQDMFLALNNSPITTDRTIDILSKKNRAMANLPEIIIERGSKANLTFFDTDSQNNKPPFSQSKGANQIHFKNTVKGCVIGTLVGTKFITNNI